MAQLRQEYSKFVELDTEILAVGPDGPNAYKRFWDSEQMPFIGLSDVGNKISKQFFQEFNLLKFGWVPALFIIDKNGQYRFIHYGKSMADIPENDQVLRILSDLK
jgi:peroxiredoxin Q/BCP